ncbi:MAG TPA: transglycosylase SLT domain-containing protein [Bordetella sp.]
MTQDPETARYQKSASPVRPSAAWVVSRIRLWLPMLAMVIAACSSVDAQQSTGAPAAAQAPALASLATGPLPVFHAAIQPRPVQAGLPPSPDTPARQALIDAHDAQGRPQWGALAQAAAAQARDDPLGIYAEYWLLRYKLAFPLPGSHPFDDAQQFLDAHPQSYLADKLRADLILMAAARGDFQAVQDLGEPINRGPAVACARLDAQHMTGRRATAEQALAVFQPVRSCWKLYDQLVADGVLGWDQIMPLLRDAIEDNRIPAATQLAGYIFENNDRKKLAVLLKDPLKWLARQSKSVVGRNEKALLSIALARLARQDLNTADAYFRNEWERYMAKGEAAWVRSQYALAAAYAQDDRAEQWYREAGDVRLSKTGQAWRVRSALRAARIDWKWVLACIAQMPPEQQAEPGWVYWKARGLAASGQADAASQAYAGIADQFNFYGQLASEELGRPIVLPPEAAPVTSAEMAEARRNPGLVRAVQLFRLGWRAEAVPEWNFALRGMTDRQLLAAAELARAEDIYDRVVNTSELTAHEFDFTQRYIAPFDGKVAAKAQAISLDPAWVYGLIRQESRFVTQAHSYVGAAGLMQIMPATAKWVAKKIGMTDFDPTRVHDFDVNTELGTQYLNIVLQAVDGSQMLASAGYNAGPGRPRNWRAALSHGVEGAIFAETIPFNETRDYVQKVMANATYYAVIFTGRPQSLKARLGLVDPGQSQVLANSDTQ